MSITIQAVPESVVLAESMIGFWTLGPDVAVHRISIPVVG